MEIFVGHKTPTAHNFVSGCPYWLDTFWTLLILQKQFSFGYMYIFLKLLSCYILWTLHLLLYVVFVYKFLLLCQLCYFIFKCLLPTPMNKVWMPLSIFVLGVMKWYHPCFGLLHTYPWKVYYLRKMRYLSQRYFRR